MKTYIKHPFLRPALVAGLGFLLAGRGGAQNLTELYNFPVIAAPNAHNSEGTYPTSGVLISSNMLYGLTAAGGANGGGTVFGVTTNGTGFTNLYNFDNNLGEQNGLYPKYGLALSNNVLYGTTCYGGISNYGTVFSVRTDGSGYRLLHDFLKPDGINPSSTLLLSGNTLYGSTISGGTRNGGTVFKLNTQDAALDIVYAFPVLDTNNGQGPVSGVVLSPSGTTLYGTTFAGGASRGGTIFAVSTSGSGLQILHSFPAPLYQGEGFQPKATLLLSPDGETLYGTTQYGGYPDNIGTIFAINTDGSNFRTLHNFGPNGAPAGIRAAQVLSPLLLSGNGQVLYGSAICDDFPYIGPGYTAGGTIFGMTTDGSAYGVLHAFGTVWSDSYVNVDGALPSTLLRVGKTLYDTAANGGYRPDGWSGGGTVFRIFLGLAPLVSATNQASRLNDTIKVTVTVLNSDWETINNVHLAGPLTVNTIVGTNVVAAAGFSGPTLTPTLTPMKSTTFTYLFTAKDYGAVTFTATVTGLGPDGVVTSMPATSPLVIVAPQADLMVKSTDPQDVTFGGVGIFQQPPPFNDQDLSQAVSTNGAAAYILRLQSLESKARSYLLKATTNGTPNWTVKVLSGSNNISGALLSSSGWTTPELAPNGYVDLQVSLTPLPGAGVLDNKFIQFTALIEASYSIILDTMRLHATLVPIPVTLTLNAVDPGGYSPESVNAGLSDLNAPLVPSTNTTVLANHLRQIHGGLVADGVTPLVFRLEAKPADLAQFKDGKDFVFQTDYPSSGNSLAGTAIMQRFQALNNGVWQSTNVVTLSTNKPVSYVQLRPIQSDDLIMSTQPPGVVVHFAVQDKASGVQSGDINFALQKPPIALVHGYATAGDWGDDFKATLGSTRPYGLDVSPNNFIVTVKYGQDTPPGWAAVKFLSRGLIPAYGNTVGTLNDCAQLLHVELLGAMNPLHANWAFTRFDVIGHSQGGVLSRMLCNHAVTPTIAWPFRNEFNFNRGRFHRVVTVGSPHNGSRLLHYLLDLNDAGFFHDRSTLGNWAVLSLYAQSKFDPFLEQIRNINTSASPWWPDPDARFHLMRMTIDNGASPTKGDHTLSYLVLGLAMEGGGAAVIPAGSDGIVDFASMGAQDATGNWAPNVFTFPFSTCICHAEPSALFNNVPTLFTSRYLVTSETADPNVALHALNALDQQYLAASDMVFAAFPQVALLGPTDRQLIDTFATNKTYQALTDQPILLPAPHDAFSAYQYQIQFPTNLPPAGDVAWSVQIYDANGITDDGVALSFSGTSNNLVTVTVDSALVGDVVLSATYMSTNNTLVVIPPTLVVSRPPAAATLTGFQLSPATIALPIGTVVTPQFWATYSDGSTSLRFVRPDAVQAISSQPAVVSVADPLNWQLNALGNAQVRVSWSGFTATAQVTVFDPNANTAPALSIQRSGNGQLSIAWPGYTTGYVLESATNVAQLDWQPVATAPLRGAGWTSVPMTNANTQQFFRLRWDPSAINF